VGGRFFAFSWPGESKRPSSLPSITPLQQTLKYWLNKTNCLKPLLQLININASNL